MRYLTLIFLLAGGLSADQIYTWAISPITPYVDPEGVTIYSGVIETDEPYTEPTIQYSDETFDVDVATFGVPGPGFEDFFVLTTARPSEPSSVPEPPLLPLIGAAIAGAALIRERKGLSLIQIFSRPGDRRG